MISKLDGKNIVVRLLTNLTIAAEVLFDQLLPFETPLTPIGGPSAGKSIWDR